MLSDCGDSRKLYLQFEIADADGSQSLTTDEVKQLFAESGLGEDKAKNFMEKFDVNKDGQVSIDEFSEVLGIKEKPMPDFRSMFQAVDKDNSGAVSINELQDHFKESDKKDMLPKLDEYLKKHDKDGSGQLEYREFLRFLLELL